MVAPLLAGAMIAGGSSALQGAAGWYGGKSAGREGPRAVKGIKSKLWGRPGKLRKFQKKYGEETGARLARGYEQTELETLAPWIAGGLEGFEELKKITLDPSQYKESPGFQWLRDKYLSGVNARAIAGGRYGGRRLLELEKEAGGLALQDYGGQVGRLTSLAGFGERASRERINTLMKNMELFANARMGAASQAAGATAGQYGALSSAIGGVGQAAAGYGADVTAQAQFDELMKRYPAQTPPIATPGSGFDIPDYGGGSGPYFYGR